MQHFTQISSFSLELKAIQADERLAVLSQTKLDLAKIQASFYHFINSHTQLVYALYNNAAVKYSFYDYLINKLMPSNGPLAQCPIYWKVVLSEFSKNYVTELKFNNYKRASKVQSKTDMTSIVNISAYSMWLQTIFAGHDMQIFDRNNKNDYFIKIWVAKAYNSKFDRLFVQFAVQSILQSPLKNDNLLRFLLNVLGKTEQLLQTMDQKNPLNTRNLTNATMGFLETVLPILERRFGKHKALELILHNFNGFFTHWVYRKNRNMALALRWENEVLCNVKNINGKLPFQWLPYSLLAVFNNKEQEKTWSNAAIVHVLNGKSLRTAPELPCALTAKVAHLFNEMILVDYNQAMLYARGYACGVSSIFLGEIISNNTRVFWFNEPFFEEFCSFISRNAADFNRHELRPLVDYLSHIKRAQPNFTLAGRTPNTIRRLMEDWHLEMRQMNYLTQVPIKWKPVSVKGFQ
jgi:hypothetical protein